MVVSGKGTFDLAKKISKRKNQKCSPIFEVSGEDPREEFREAQKTLVVHVKRIYDEANDGNALLGNTHLRYRGRLSRTFDVIFSHL